jgi:hypothetical protein
MVRAAATSKLSGARQNDKFRPGQRAVRRASVAQLGSIAARDLSASLSIPRIAILQPSQQHVPRVPRCPCHTVDLSSLVRACCRTQAELSSLTAPARARTTPVTRTIAEHPGAR